MLDSKELVAKARGINWEFSDADTQSLSHNIHRYSGKFIPQIAKTVIEMVTSPGEIVLDPYLGSGTTALEAILLERKSIGVDLNPLAILISKVKTTVLDKNGLRAFQQKLLASLAATMDGQTVSGQALYIGQLKNPEDSWRFCDEWNNKWYQPHVLGQFIMIYDVIESVDDLRLQRIAQVAFSDILRKYSNANSRFPNVMYDKDHKMKNFPYKGFVDSFNATIEKLVRLSDALGEKQIDNDIFLCNNTKMPLPDGCVDAIVTHPPYIAAVPYAEYGCLSLEWFGCSSKELDGALTGGKRHRKDVIARFESDYNLMIQEAFRILKHDKYAFFMVGNPTVQGEIVDLHEMTVQLCQANGFIPLYTATRTGGNRRGNKMGIEYLEFFRKP